MRSSPLNGTSLEEALEKLIQEFARNTPLDPTFEVAGDPYSLEATVGMTCFRTVQESLTNVQKHARDPQQLDIYLEYKPQEVLIRVRDDGLGGSEGEVDGYGLAGLQERALQLGGKFKAGADPSGGYTLEVKLPTGSEHD